MSFSPNLDRGSPFCTYGESIGGVLHVAPEHHGAVRAEERRTHRELGVGRVGELARPQALQAQALAPNKVISLLWSRIPTWTLASSLSTWVTQGAFCSTPMVELARLGDMRGLLGCYLPERGRGSDAPLQQVPLSGLATKI